MAAEVISHNDLAWDLSKKVQDYLAAGVKLVWGLDPAAELIQVRRPGKASIILSHTDDLSGADVVPGFRCPVSDLFAPTPGLV